MKINKRTAKRKNSKMNKLSKVIKAWEQKSAQQELAINGFQKQIQGFQEDLKKVEAEYDELTKDLKQRAMGIQAMMKEVLPKLQEAQTQYFAATNKIAVLKEFYEQITERNSDDSEITEVEELPEELEAQPDEA